MTIKEKRKCRDIIHNAAASCAGVGFITAQVPLSDSLIIMPIQIKMIIDLGNVFNKEITESVAKSLLLSATASVVGRGVASALVGWVPVLGNSINASTAAGVTEAIGWAAAKHFDEE